MIRRRVFIALLRYPAEEAKFVGVAAIVSTQGHQAILTHSPEILSTQVPSSFFHSLSGPKPVCIRSKVSDVERISLLRLLSSLTTLLCLSLDAATSDRSLSFILLKSQGSVLTGSLAIAWFRSPFRSSIKNPNSYHPIYRKVPYTLPRVI